MGRWNGNKSGLFRSNPNAPLAPGVTQRATSNIRMAKFGLVVCTRADFS